jgi:hypothetical protein
MTTTTDLSIWLSTRTKVPRHVTQKLNRTSITDVYLSGCVHSKYTSLYVLRLLVGKWPGSHSNWKGSVFRLSFGMLRWLWIVVHNKEVQPGFVVGGSVWSRKWTKTCMAKRVRRWTTMYGYKYFVYFVINSIMKVIDGSSIQVRLSVLRTVMGLGMWWPN